MKTLFALMLGTIALFLAVTAQDALSAQIFLAALGVALYAVALNPGSARGELKVAWLRKQNAPAMGEFHKRPHSKVLHFQE